MATTLKERQLTLTIGATWADYDPTTVGFTGAVSKQCRYMKFGKTVIYHGYITGTSNADTLTATVPATVGANVGTVEIPCFIKDNGTWKVGTVNLMSNATTVRFGNANAGIGAFTTSGAKGCEFEIIYECS